MAKGPNQKLKLLYLKDILETHSDEMHPILMKDILSSLSAQGVFAERKSIYDDIEVLRSYGLDIIYEGGKNGGYYIGTRTFELPELKLLVDAVQSSKFITLKKSRELIAKIENLSSKYDAALLQRQVYVTNRVKTVNEQIYYNIDALHDAINQNVQITFQYFEWQVNIDGAKQMTKQLRKNGNLYTVSPWALTWDDENYYLIAYELASDIIKHYRVDKMQTITLLADSRNGQELFNRFDMAIYSKKMFGMFGGKERLVKIQFANRLIGVVVDRFGDNLVLQKGMPGTFCIEIHAAISSQFFSWVSGFENEACIIAPASIVASYQTFLRNSLQNYETDN